MAQQDAVVRIERHFLIGSPRGPIRLLAFRFDFPGRDKVDIKGLGLAPARGAFQYFTLDDKLEFRETETRRTLLTVPLKDPVEAMGRYSVILPAPTDFSPAFRSGRWEHNTSFLVRLDEVLNKQFPSGYMVLQLAGANAVVTTYHLLDGVREPLYGRVAVLVEPPVDAAHNTTFQVRFTGQERRSHTDWQEVSSKEVQEAVNQDINFLVSELEDRGR